MSSFSRVWLFYFYFICQSCLFLSITIWIDHRAQNEFKGEDAKKQTVERTQLEERKDVIDHKKFAEANWERQEEFLIQGKDITKVYKGGVAAVKHNTFAVRKGEVFGLLGPNGAGKSSMFNMMTADMKRSGGDIKIMDTKLNDLDLVAAGSKMGICPQFNPLCKNLTVD